MPLQEMGSSRTSRRETLELRPKQMSPEEMSAEEERQEGIAPVIDTQAADKAEAAKIRAEIEAFDAKEQAKMDKKIAKAGFDRPETMQDKSMGRRAVEAVGDTLNKGFDATENAVFSGPDYTKPSLWSRFKSIFSNTEKMRQANMEASRQSAEEIQRDNREARVGQELATELSIQKEGFDEPEQMKSSTMKRGVEAVGDALSKVYDAPTEAAYRGPNVVEDPALEELTAEEKKVVKKGRASKAVEKVGDAVAAPYEAADRAAFDGQKVNLSQEDMESDDILSAEEEAVVKKGRARKAVEKVGDAVAAPYEAADQALFDGPEVQDLEDLSPEEQKLVKKGAGRQFVEKVGDAVAAPYEAADRAAYDGKDVTTQPKKKSWLRRLFS